MIGQVNLIDNIKAGCKQVLIPYENEQDYIKLLIQTKKSIEIVLVNTI